MHEHCREVDRPPRRWHCVNVSTEEGLAEVSENRRPGGGAGDAQLGRDSRAFARR